MADTKISAATAVVTPASTDEFPCNQGGTSKKQTRAQLHTLEVGEQLLIPSDNDAVTPSLAFGTTDKGFYAVGTSTMKLAFAGAPLWTWTAAIFSAESSGGGFIKPTGASSTNPGIGPRTGDTDTGIGWLSNGNLSMVCDGAEAGRFEDPADLTAGETSLWLYDDDNATIEQVTVGAADSGGAGFKVLRIPN